MPRTKFPKPWYRSSRRTWYVEIDGKQYNLGPDPDEALVRYHALMRDRPRDADCSLAVGVIDSFFEWVRQNQAPRTYEWYHRHCEAFARSILPLAAGRPAEAPSPDPAALRPSRLVQFHQTRPVPGRPAGLQVSRA